MAHHIEKKEDITKLYFAIGTVAGLFVGFLLDMGIGVFVISGIVGFLFSVFFYNVLVRGRVDE